MRSRLPSLLALGASTLLATSSCSDGPPGEKSAEEVSTRGQELNNSVFDSTGAFRAVGAFRPGFFGGDSDGISICSGTLIAPRTVLTAAHCVQKLGTGCGTAKVFGTGFQFADATGHRDTSTAPTARVRAVVTHPKAYFYSPFCGAAPATPPSNACPTTAAPYAPSCTGSVYCPNELFGINLEYDIALVFLDDDAPAGVSPLPIVLHNSFAGSTISATAGYVSPSSVQTWASTTTRPRVYLVGYGSGSPFDSAPKNTGRGIGIANADYSSDLFKLWTSCTAQGPEAAGDAIYARAPDAQSQVWNDEGDSGGPMIAGPAGLTIKNIQTTGLPGGFTGDTTKNYVMSVASAANPAQRFARHTPTYKQSISQWLVDNLSGFSDGDAYSDKADNCPSVANPDQLDTDNDGIGNACDPCPCSTQKTNGLEDDGDGVCDNCYAGFGAYADPQGVCGSYCATAVVDNCPGVLNADQANCNADAERREGAEPLGDACDPVPCPQFTPGKATIEVTSTTTTYTGPGSTLVTTVRTVDRGEQAFDLQGSRGHWKLPVRNTLYPWTVAQTRYRYCTNLTSPFTDCDDNSWVGKDAVIDQTEFFDSGWHRVRLTTWADENQVDPSLTYGGTAAQNQFKRTWDWQTDFARWHQKWPSTFTMEPPYEINEGKGRFWANARTDIGTIDTTSLPSGKHELLSGGSNPTPARLANHFSSFAPVEQDTQSTTFKLPIISIPAFVSDCAPVGCPPDTGVPSLDDCSQCALVPSNAFAVYPAMPLTRYSATQSTPVGALAFDGSFVPMDNNLSPTLKRRFTQGFTWAGAVETSAAIGASSSYPQFVALSADGTQVVERVTMLRRGMLTAADERGDRPLASSPTAPAARNSFVPVYSRSTGQVFVVGGKNGSNVPMGDIWSRALSGVWMRWQATMLGTSTAYTPGNVIAATYSYRDSSLYVLDIPAGSSQVRLVRLNLRGTAEQLGQWTPGTNSDRRWLALDRNGEVLLVVAKDSTAETKIFRIDNPNVIGSGTPTVAGVMSFATAAKFAPLVDTQEYWVIGQTGSGQTPDVRHPNRLVLTAATWASLGAAL